MKRQLSEEEKNISEKSLKRIKKEITDLKGNLDYNKALIIKQKYLREFDNDWREYLQKRKDEEDNKIIKQIENLLKEKENTLKELNKQLKDGVEPPTGVG